MKKNKQYFVFFFVIELFLTPNYSRPQNDKISCAVIQLDGHGISEVEILTLTDKLRDEIFKTKKYKIVEREKVDEILKEQGFQQTGCTTDKCLIEVGKIIAVNRIIGGSIGKVGQTYSVSARMIDVESGEIVKIANENYSGKIDNLLTDVVPRIASKIAELPFPIYEYKSTPNDIAGTWQDKNGRIISIKQDIAICVSAKEENMGWINQIVMKDIIFRNGKWYALTALRNSSTGRLIKWLPVSFQVIENKIQITHLAKLEKRIKYNLIWTKVF